MAAAGNDNLAEAAAPDERPGRLGAWLASLDDGHILRAAFAVLLMASAAVLGSDLRAMRLEDAAGASAAPDTVILPQVGLPAVRKADDTGSKAARDDIPTLVTDADDLRQAMRFELTSGGVLEATGTIGIGSAAAFRAEIEKRGEYVKKVTLDSPGGSVSDALEISRLAREKGIATEVGDGHLCASSCPIILAGGSERIASRRSAIGVHQIFAADGVSPAAFDGMAEAQRVSAEIARHMTAMDISPEVWIHAMETPKDQLFYFTPEALTEFRLATTLTD